MPIALYALALAAFSIGTAEFVISGILPALSADLAVSIPTAGLLVTGYAAGVAVGGPLLAMLVSRFERRLVIVSVMLLFAAGQVLCALAPDYGTLMAARLVSAAAHGVFFGVANVAAANLVPPDRRASAIATVVGGITIANLLGLPGGTLIGNALGWRATFWTIAIVATLAALVITILLPRGEEHAEGAPTLKAQFMVLRHQQVWGGYLVIILAMIGALAVGVYQVPLLIEVARVNPDHVPAYLLVGGIGSMIGIYLGGKLGDRWLHQTLIGMLIVQIAAYAVLLGTAYDPILAGITLFVVNGAGFGFGTPNTARILTAARAAPNMASTLVSTAYNIGIAAGAFLGAMLLNGGLSYALLPLVGIVTSSFAIAVAAWSWWMERRALPAPA
jgi:DHA1 family inner membrane transport protein